METKLAAFVNGGGIWTSQSTPAPVLKLPPAAGSLVVSWTVPSMEFWLQESTDLTATN